MNIEQVIKKLQWRCQGKYRLRAYVRDYITRCVTFREPLQFITIWCVSKSLEERFKRQRGFVALPGERKTLTDFKELQELFAQVGVLVNHFIFLVGSGVPGGKVAAGVTEQYLKHLSELSAALEVDVVILPRPVAVPDPNLLGLPMLQLPNPSWFEALQRESARRLKLAKSRGVRQAPNMAEQEAQLSIEVKATEASELVNEFGDFILIPVEYVERYQFHNLGYPGFTDRLLPITKPYPWRMSD